MIFDFDKTALIVENKELTYKTILKKIKIFSEYLYVNEGDKILIFSENREGWIYSLYAVWAKNAVAIPIYYKLNTDELGEVIVECEPKKIFVSRQKLPDLEIALQKNNLSLDFIIIEDLENIANAKFNEAKAADIHYKKDDIALISYTSGTLGKAKPVVISFGNLIFNINAVINSKLYQNSDKIIALLPFNSTFALFATVIVPLYIGATCVLAKSLEANDLMQTFQVNKVTVIIGVVQLYEILIKSIKEKINEKKITKLLWKITLKINSLRFSKLVFKKIHKKFGGNIRLMVVGGMKLPLYIYNDFRAIGFELLEGYGATETAPIVSFSMPNKSRAQSVGKLIDGMQIKIINEEIVVKGPNIAKNYYNKNHNSVDNYDKLENKLEKNDSDLFNGWFFTGDIGFINEDSYIYIKGRRNEFATLPNGKTIIFPDIEDIIEQNFARFVKEIGVYFDFEDEKLKGILVPQKEIFNSSYLDDNSSNFNENSNDFNNLDINKDFLLQNFLKKNVIEPYNNSVVPFKRIKKITVSYEDLPRTTLGKPKRHLLNSLEEKI